MNFTFQQYPSHPWKSGWVLETRNCSTSFRKDGSGYFFRTAETVGRICPNEAQPDWAVQIPVPQNCHASMLFNGFCGYLKYKKKLFAAEVLTPEPGVLWGQSHQIAAPVFITELPVEEVSDGFYWVETDKVPALLAIRGEQFCLVTKARKRMDAVEIAENYLAQDLDEQMQQECDLRAGAATLFEQISRHDALAVTSIEQMMRAIRPPEAKLPYHWSQSPTDDNPKFSTNELYPLVLAWRYLDVEVAESLILNAFQLQASTGAIPVSYSFNETYSILESPRPLIASAAEKVWEIRRDPDFLKQLLLPLRRYIQWMLQHFDPKHRGWYFWQNRSECIVPELYESEAATVDLTVLLLAEIDACNRLQDATGMGDEKLFVKERESLEDNLKMQFWNEQEGDFGNAYLRGKLVRIPGFLGFVPLVWPGLPERYKTLVLDRIRDSGSLPGGVSILSWRDADSQKNGFSRLQQVLSLEAFKQSDPKGLMLRDYARVMLEGFVNWHAEAARQNDQQLDAVTSALIVNLQETHGYRHVSRGRVTDLLYKLRQKTKADRTDMIIVGTSLFVAFGVHIIYDLLHQPEDYSVLYSNMSAAYEHKDGEATLQNSLAIIKDYPDDAALARLYAGNIFLMREQFEEAADLFVELREEYPDSPAAMISAGMALQQQGRFAEADVHYKEFTMLFDLIFPNLTAQVQDWRYMMMENLPSPPNWKNIYRYKMMHEL